MRSLEYIIYKNQGSIEYFYFEGFSNIGYECQHILSFGIVVKLLNMKNQKAMPVKQKQGKQLPDTNPFPRDLLGLSK